MMNKRKCPVCGEYEFESADDFEICKVCGWEDDGIQLATPNLSGGAKRMSLTQTRKAWSEDREVK